MTTKQTILHGITGFAASFISVLTTLQEQLEWWIRLLGGTCGLLIAIVTLYRLVFVRPFWKPSNTDTTAEP